MNKILSMVLWKVGLFAAFMILVGTVNLLQIEDKSLSIFMGFINSNIWLIILFVIMFITSDVLWEIEMPYYMGYPVFNALGGIFLVMFLYKMGDLIDQVYGVVLIFKGWEWLIYPATAIVVLALGYVNAYKRYKKHK